MRSDDPRIEELIASEQCTHVPGSGVTFCTATLTCGHQVVAYTVKSPKHTSETDLVEARKDASVRVRQRIASMETYHERRCREEQEKTA